MAPTRCVIFTVMLCMAVAQLVEEKVKTAGFKDEEMALDVKLDGRERAERCHCYFPKRYEGKMKELVGSSVNGKSYMTDVEVFYALDAEAKKVAVREVVTMGHKVMGMFKIVADIGKEEMFVVDEEKKNCTVIPLPQGGSMDKSLGVLKNATHLGTHILGGSLKTDMYHYGINSKAANMTIFLTVANKRGFFHRRKYCLPVHETAFVAVRTPFGNFSSTIAVEFYDIKEKISNPEIFDKPNNCKPATPELLQALSALMQFMNQKFLGQ